MVDHFAAVRGPVFLLPLDDPLHDDIEAAMPFAGVLPSEFASFAGQAVISRPLACQNTPECLLHRFPSQGPQVSLPAPLSCGAPERRARQGQRGRHRTAQCRGGSLPNVIHWGWRGAPALRTLDRGEFPASHHPRRSLLPLPGTSSLALTLACPEQPIPWAR